MLLPARPCCGPEAKPMQTALAPAPAVEADVPIAVVADRAIVVNLVLDVLFVTGDAVDERLFIPGQWQPSGSSRRRRDSWTDGDVDET